MGNLRVKEPFSVDLGGVSYVMTDGLVVGDDHPAVKGREHLFERADLVDGALPRRQAHRLTGMRHAREDPEG